MFPIYVPTILPVSKVFVQSVAVRGGMGPMTVWKSQSEAPFSLEQEHWKLIHRATHSPSHKSCTELKFDQPLELLPGSATALYIHSAAPGDEAIVYDDFEASHRQPTLVIGPSKAHLSPTPFDQVPIWGAGIAWRDRRSFVGQIRYGVVYQLYRAGLQFGPRFEQAADTFRSVLTTGDAPKCRLPPECVDYILHLCPWHWFGDTVEDIKQEHRRKRQRNVAVVQDDDEAKEEDLDAEARWELANGYRADTRFLAYDYCSSDEEHLLHSVEDDSSSSSSEEEDD